METEKLADTKQLIQTKWNNYCTKEKCLKRKYIFGAIIIFNIILVIVIAIAVYYSGNEVHGKPPDGASPNKEDGQNYECLENSRLVQQVNLCQKLLFMYQLTHNMTKDFSLIYQFST